MNNKDELKRLIDVIKKVKGWTQQQVSVGAGYEEKSLTQALSKKAGQRPVIERLKLVYKDVLENPTMEVVKKPDAIQLIVERLLIIQAHQNVQKSMLEKIYAHVYGKDQIEVESTIDMVFEQELSKLKDELKQGS